MPISFFEPTMSDAEQALQYRIDSLTVEVERLRAALAAIARRGHGNLGFDSSNWPQRCDCPSCTAHEALQ